MSLWTFKPARPRLCGLFLISLYGGSGTSKLLPAPVHRKIQLLWPLAFASVFWCAGVAAPNSSVLDSIQTETLNVFTSSFTHEVPAFLKHVLLGWHTSPQFLQDFTALRRAALFGALRPLWLEDAPLTEGAASWMALLPQARDALQRHGWTALPHEQGFSRTDALGRRRDFHFGHTSLRVLRQWLEEAFVSQGVHKCGRVRDGFHRPDPACARGLDLPKPPKTATFSFAAHRACLLAPARTLISESGSCGRSQLLVPSLWQASQGAGAGGQALHVWPHGALSTPPLEAYPPAPATCHDEGPELCADLLAVVQNSPGDPGFVATDGSALDEVAGASVVLLTGGRLRTYGFSDNNEDQSSFRAELLALRAITASCRECVAQGRGPLADLYILCDCQAAVLAVQSPDACALPALAREIADNLSVSGQAGFHVYIRWCPAHDRCPGWAPEFPLDASTCRFLNDRADEKAKQIMRARHQASARAQWHTQQRLANEWSAAAIQLSSVAGDAYRRSCERRRLAGIRLVGDDCDDAL